MEKRYISIRYYLSFVYIELMTMLLFFVSHAKRVDHMTWVYIILLLIVYPLVYLMPTISITYILKILINRMRPEDHDMRWPYMLFYGVLIILTSATALLAFADYQLYSLYEYHVNGFVINLIMAPGGIASLGATPSTKATCLAISILFLIAHTALFLIVYHLSSKGMVWPYTRRFAGKVFVIILCLMVTEEVIHGYADFVYNDSILRASSTIPFSMGLQFNTLAMELGFKRPHRDKVCIKEGNVEYPLKRIKFERVQRPCNIVWLTVESLRWDMLDPKIMPNLWQLSKIALKFDRHYSGGNRTRMGMFTMFYGLYPTYWYPFERQAIGPVFIEALLHLGYKMDVRTSQSFTYPELYRTVFAEVPKKWMHELKDQSIPAWKRDELNITQMLKFMDKEKGKGPFFVFMFFESTHAPYNFTDKDIVCPDYLRDMNYAHLKLLTETHRIKARYINAAHCVDRQVGRTLNFLKTNGLMQNTVFLLTGDHGEEFMEHGHWGHGHNAAFPEQQVHVPLVLWLPGKGHREIHIPTSHIDIIGTLAPIVGIHADLQYFSQGSTLLHRREKYQIFGNYRYMAYMDSRYKIIFPYRDYDYFYYRVTGADDSIVDKKTKEKVLHEYRDTLRHLAYEAQKYLKNRLHRPAEDSKISFHPYRATPCNRL